jgi:hypothetical protein
MHEPVDGIPRDLSDSADADEDGCTVARPSVVWLGGNAPPRRLRELLVQRGLRLGNEPGERAVLCFGPGASADDVKRALDAHSASAAIVLASRETAGDFQELIDADRLFYFSRGELAERDLLTLIDSAASLLAPRSEAAPPDGILPAAGTLRRLALATSVAELADTLQGAVAAAVSAERARCLLFDRERQTLWAPADGADSDEGESTAAGLVSFVLRTGATLCLANAGDDGRFDRDLDDPRGDHRDRFLAAPVRAGGRDVVAVLVALRSPRERPFEPRDVAAIEAVAAHAAPHLAAWLPAAAEDDNPFRRRALREIELPATAAPEPLRLEPAWTRRASWLAAAAFAAALLAAVFVQLPEYASGVAVVTGPRTIVAFLPARYLTQLHRGMRLRVDLTPQWLEIESVKAEAIGPAEARRLIGPKAADAVDLHGALAAVTARLPAGNYPRGIQSRARIRLRSQRLLFSLMPGAAHG